MQVIYTTYILTSGAFGFFTVRLVIRVLDHGQDLAVLWYAVGIFGISDVALFLACITMKNAFLKSPGTSPAARMDII